MRLIDADAVIGILYRLTPFNSKGIQLFNSIEERINALPTIEIVRCKECIFAEIDTEADMYLCRNYSFPCWNRGEHFCSDGVKQTERREP